MFFIYFLFFVCVSWQIYYSIMIYTCFSKPWLTTGLSCIVSMSTEFKLNVTVNPDVKESDFNSSLEISPHGGKVNVVRRLIGGFLPQGKRLSDDILSTTERRGTNER